MAILLKRVYDEPVQADGYRVLVERLWPRGISKQDAAIDFWSRDTAPSAELRRWFNHDPERWAEFKERYFAELRDETEALAPIIERVERGDVTFVFASRETRYNNAVALKEYIEARL